VVLPLPETADTDQASVGRRDQISPSRYHNIVPLSSPRDVDAQLVDWLETAYELVS